MPLFDRGGLEGVRLQTRQMPQNSAANPRTPLILHFLDGGDGGWSIVCVDLRLLALLVSMPDRASYKGLGRVSVLL